MTRAELHRTFSLSRPARGALSSRLRAFTLIEVMISIFLVLILIIGINQAFKVVSSTVGAGQAMSAKSRDSFTAQSAFVQEIGRALVHDDSAPFLIIGSRYQPAFRNKQDRESDRDYNEGDDVLTRYGEMLTIDLDNNNAEGDANIPGERLSPVQMSERNHRVDILSFFARDLYRRQTGNGATDTLPGTTSETIIPRGTTPAYSWASQSFAADQSSNQAYVSYGHLWMPRYDSTGAPRWYLTSDPNQQTYPGAGTAQNDENPNNFYAADWILGRMAILLAGSVYPPDLSLETPLLWGQGSTSENWKQMETIRRANALVKQLAGADPLLRYVDAEQALLGPFRGLL